MSSNQAPGSHHPNAEFDTSLQPAVQEAIGNLSVEDAFGEGSKGILGILDSTAPQDGGLVVDAEKVNALSEVRTKILEPTRDKYNEHDEAFASSVRQAEAALETVDDLDTDAKQELCNEIKTILLENPQIIPDLQSQGHDFGAQSRESVTAARESLTAALSTITQLEAKIKGQAHELVQLRLDRAEQVEHQQIITQGPNFNDAATTISNQGTSNLLLLKVLGLPDDPTLFDHDILRIATQMALEFESELLSHDIFEGSTSWTDRIQGLTSPSDNHRGARERSAWLLAQTCIKSPSSRSFSLADIHALAKSMQTLPAEELKIVVAFLQGFILRIGNLIITEEACSVNRALIFLRAIELFCDFVQPLKHLLTTNTIFEQSRPYLVRSCEQSRLARGLAVWIETLFSTRQPKSLAQVLIAHATQDHLEMVLHDRTMFMDHDNLFIIQNDQVTFVRPDHCELTANCFGWWLLTVRDPDGQKDLWTTRLSFLEPGAWDNVERVFCRMLDRLGDGNPAVSISETDRLLVDI